MDWHILNTVPRREFRAAKELKELGLTPFVPYEVVHRRGIGKGNRPITIEVEVPLISRYVFVTGKYLPWYDIESLWDVTGHATFNGIRAVVSDAEIDRMRRAMEGRRVGIDNRRSFKKGDKVRVNDGPFRDMAALVEHIGLGSVRISVQLFGRSTPATIRPDQIERAA